MEANPNERKSEVGDITTSEGFKKHVVHALHVAKQRLDEKKQKANFVRIIMRFPQIKSVFKRIRVIHKKCDESGDGLVDMDELMVAIGRMLNEGKGDTARALEPATIARSLSLSDLQHEGGVDQKGFIVLCAIGFVLAEDNPDIRTIGGILATEDDEYCRAMTDVVTAYLSFDREGKGYFTSDEFEGFMGASKRADAARSFFTDERWSELDYSGDGKVEFEEFVYAFSKWVCGDDEDDDEDEDDDLDCNTSSPCEANPLKKRILLALQLSKNRLEKDKSKVNFTRIIMRFPKINKVFDRIRSVHAKFDADGEGHIDLKELKSAITEVFNVENSDEGDSVEMDQIENIFMLSDFNHDGSAKGLTVKEFIVFCAVGFILAEAGGRTAKTLRGMVSNNDEHYRAAMMDIVRAYLTFDTDGKGYFTAMEMHSAVADVGKKDAGSLLTPERWSELDYHGNGKVDFEEFVYAFSCWVAPFGDEGDEEEEQ